MKKTIFLIDDENVFHFINTKVITLTGLDCDIQTASNGKEALEIIYKLRSISIDMPDYIFVDLNMPVMDGFEFIQAFKEIEIHSREKTTLIILSSSMDPKDQERAVSLGIEHFITKPMSEEDIKGIIL